MQVSDPGYYDYLPYNQRRQIVWPNGARIAFWVAPNIEWYEYDPPPNPFRKPWGRPHPDVTAYGYRDYGNRAGHWRLMDVMDKYGVRGSISLSVAMCEHCPEIIEACKERNWEFYSHGIYNTRYTYGMTEEQERAMMEDAIATIKKHTGQDVAGWLAPALSHTPRIMDLLAQYGVKYTCDLFHDDQPLPVKVKKGRLISIPYSLEMNDTVVYHGHQTTPRRYGEIIKRNFDRLYEEGADSGTVMCIPLHAYQVGMPHRIAAFEEALAYITSHKDVWVTTGREIADYYYENYYDDVVRDIEAFNKGA